MTGQRPPVAIAHDYLTQRGGAERVVLALHSTYPDAPVHTSFYDPKGTFPEFAGTDIRVSALDRVRPLRRRHRLALPLLAPAFSAMRIDAGVTICSSSGWSHGARTSGRKIVYCHTPARWLYQAGPYLAGMPSVAGSVLGALGPALRSWDRRAAATADRYLVNSHAVRRRVEDLYRRDAEVLPPPVSFGPDGPTEPVRAIEPGFVLCVSRLLAYKNIGAVVEAFRLLPHDRLVVVGTGPLAASLPSTAPPNVVFAGEVDDARLRWLYASCSAVVAASYEDFGLTPVEAAGFGKPVAVLRWGGFLDTTVEGETGRFFERPDAPSVADAVRTVLAATWSETQLLSHAADYSPERFAARLASIVAEETSHVS